MQNAMTSLTPFRRALAASALILNFGLACAHAEMSRDKEDVTDPALKDIISSFEQVMPKFVNQHGFSKFITDENVTRGMFIRAMYEYNKFLETNLLAARDYIGMLLPALPMLEPELLAGCVAVFRNSRLRVRKLPFSG